MVIECIDSGQLCSTFTLSAQDQGSEQSFKDGERARGNPCCHELLVTDSAREGKVFSSGMWLLVDLSNLSEGPHPHVLMGSTNWTQ